MYLRSIFVKNFKKFAELTAAFPSDITVVKGPNEQGKSTLLSAILAGLFFDPKKSNKDILSFKSWNADKLYELELDIEHQGERVRLYKNFETKELLLENASAKKKLSTFGSISEYLFEIGALRSLPLFEHTACVRHDALSRMTEGKREISQALQELLTSSGENVSSDRVLKKIAALASDIQRGLKQQAKNPGRLKQIEGELAELAKQKSALDAELKDIASKSAYLGTIASEHQRAAAELEAKKKQHELNAAYFRVAEEVKKLHGQLDQAEADMRALKGSEEEKEKLNERLLDYEHIKTLDIRKWYAQKEAISVKKEKLAHAEDEAKKLKAGHKPSQAHMKPLHLVVSLVLFAAGFSGFMDKRLFAIWVLFAFSFLYSFVLKRGLVVHTQKGVSAEAAGFAHEIAILEKQLEKVLSDNGVSSEEELIAKAKEYNMLLQELVKLESKAEGILRSRPRAEFERAYAELARRVAIEEQKISDEQKASPPTPQSQRLLEGEIERLSRETERLRREQEQIHTVLHSSRADREALIAVEEEIEYRTAEYGRLERKVRMLDALAQALSEAQANTIEKSRRAIEDYMRRYLLVLTDGRYDNVKVKDDLSFEVWSEEKKGMIVPEEHLSKGTIDQFYLIARFAVLDLLNKGVKSLVLLDDPFAGFDAKRRARAREMLADMTQKFQIIIFTHSSDYDSWGSVVTIE